MMKHRKLWKECFGDTDKYIDFFFRSRVLKAEAYSHYENGELTSMSYFDPKNVNLFEHKERLKYITGVATGEQYRNQGRMKLLMKSGLEEEIERNQPLVFLSPEDEKFYYSLGFRGIYYREEWEVDEFKDVPGTVQSFGKMTTEQQEAIIAFCNEQLIQGDYAFYEKRDLEYELLFYREMKALRGDLVAVWDDEEQLIAVASYYIEYGKCIVQEMICEPGKDEDAASLVYSYAKKKENLNKEKMTVLACNNLSNYVEREEKAYMMARILDLQSFIELIPENIWREAFPYVPETSGLTLIISDNLFMRNVRMYSVLTGERDEIMGFSIAELEEAIFPYIKTFLNDIT